MRVFGWGCEWKICFYGPQAMDNHCIDSWASIFDSERTWDWNQTKLRHPITVIIIFFVYRDTYTTKKMRDYYQYMHEHSIGILNIVLMIAIGSCIHC